MPVFLSLETLLDAYRSLIAIPHLPFCVDAMQSAIPLENVKTLVDFGQK